MSFGREWALYQLIGSKKAQIQILRDHIKKSNRRTYFSFVTNGLLPSPGSPLTLRKNSENFPVPFGRERVVSCIIATISNVQKNNIIRKRTFKFKF